MAFITLNVLLWPDAIRKQSTQPNFNIRSSLVYKCFKFVCIRRFNVFSLKTDDCLWTLVSMEILTFVWCFQLRQELEKIKRKLEMELNDLKEQLNEKNAQIEDLQTQLNKREEEVQTTLNRSVDNQISVMSSTKLGSIFLATSPYAYTGCLYKDQVTLKNTELNLIFPCNFPRSHCQWLLSLSIPPSLHW